ncbi:MAG: hypothetical protein EP343_23610 [Deltaproteobacteria bacterium]|nr:MAG: hypothetical protein EP343_23610 [Deltaproteobacteria bacterium]
MRVLSYLAAVCALTFLGRSPVLSAPAKRYKKVKDSFSSKKAKKAIPSKLPTLMKGYELYAWQSKKAWFFTLLPGTNRNKRKSEILSYKSFCHGMFCKLTVKGLPALKGLLKRLPKRSFVSMGRVDVAHPKRTVPMRRYLTWIKACQRAGLRCP